MSKEEDPVVNQKVTSELSLSSSSHSHPNEQQLFPHTPEEPSSPKIANVPTNKDFPESKRNYLESLNNASASNSPIKDTLSNARNSFRSPPSTPDIPSFTNTSSPTKNAASNNVKQNTLSKSDQKSICPSVSVCSKNTTSNIAPSENENTNKNLSHTELEERNPANTQHITSNPMIFNSKPSLSNQLILNARPNHEKIHRVPKPAALSIPVPGSHFHSSFDRKRKDFELNPTDSMAALQISSPLSIYSPGTPDGSNGNYTPADGMIPSPGFFIPAGHYPPSHHPHGHPISSTLGNNMGNRASFIEMNGIMMGHPHHPMNRPPFLPLGHPHHPMTSMDRLSSSAPLERPTIRTRFGPGGKPRNGPPSTGLISPLKLTPGLPHFPHMHNPSSPSQSMGFPTLPDGSIHMPHGGGKVYQCETCGKMYKHPNCLSKHKWEHSEHWKEASKFSLSKHQQVQMLEAASILVGFSSSTWNTSSKNSTSASSADTHTLSTATELPETVSITTITSDDNNQMDSVGGGNEHGVIMVDKLSNFGIDSGQKVGPGITMPTSILNESSMVQNDHPTSTSYDDMSGLQSKNEEDMSVRVET